MNDYENHHVSVHGKSDYENVHENYHENYRENYYENDHESLFGILHQNHDHLQVHMIHDG